MRGHLHHIVSNVATCTTRTANYGGSYTGGTTSADAQLVATYISGYKSKMDAAWGAKTAATDRFITADIAITSCGWGASGQAAIIQKIVDNMACLYKSGWRGMALRNSGPSDIERYMGIGNEGGFVWSTNAASVTAINNGITQATKALAGTLTCVPAAASFTVTKNASSNAWWIQIKVTPSSDVSSIVLSYTGGSTTLSPASWGGDDFTGSPASAIPAGTVTLTITSKSTGTVVTQTLAW